jgi:Concanavalin A-like lectin/glucanases superfamily/Immunoglobulin domain
MKPDKKAAGMWLECSQRFCRCLLFVLAIYRLSNPWTAHAVGTWVPLANQAPAGIVYINLLSDGTVIGQDTGEPANTWYRLTPDSHGSYVNGTWTQIASMHDGRNAYATQVLTNGQIFVAGGESGGGAFSAEVYDPLLNSWTMCLGAGCLFSDSISEILPDGNVLIAPVGPTNGGETMIYSPVSNTWIAGPQLYRGYYEDEASWVKLPDSSILCIDSPGGLGPGTNSERYIPALNRWINDANVPVDIYGGIFEMGAVLLLPTGDAFFLGAGGQTAIYTPSGSTNMGTWVAGPTVPNGQIFSDTPAAMMVNGKILCAADAVAPANGWWEYDPFANTFVQTSVPGSVNNSNPTDFRMLDLPDGGVLFSPGGAQLYEYQPDGTALSSGRPTIISIATNFYRSYHLTGTLLNGITEGAGYGDDAQMNSNYPLVRMTNDVTGFVYYARTYNWSSTGVMTGTNIVSTEFMVPQNLPAGNYSLVVVANGNPSAPVAFSFQPDSLSITKPAGFASAGPIGGPFAPVSQAYFLSNTGNSSLNWTLINTSSWLNASSTNGTLAAGGQITVIINVNSTATNLPIGIYSTTITFSNANSKAVQNIPFKLEVDPILQNGDFEFGSFAGWDLSVGQVNVSHIVGNYNGIGGSLHSPHSGLFSAFLGHNSSFGDLSQTVPTIPGQSYLLSFFLNSSVESGSANEFAVAWDGTILFDQTSLATAGWTNLQFVVSAISDMTDLEFLFQNPTNYFILDDVTLTNLPPTLSIASQPASRTIPAGSGTTLSVLVSGQPPFNFQWRKGGTNLIDGGNLSGSTTANLSVNNTAVTDSGNYSVGVSSGTLSVTSAVVTLSVLGCAMSAPSGLISWWTGNGTDFDSAGTNNGSLQNGATYAPGEVGYAFSLNGVNQYISTPNNPVWGFGTNAFSIDLWANYSAVSGSPAFLAADEGGGSTHKWIFWLNGSTLQLHVGVVTNAYYIGSANFSPNVGQWYHIALTRNGNTFLFYTNGNLASSNTATVVIPTPNAPLTIGQAEGGFDFSGLLDDVRIYNRTLSPAEVQAIYQSGSNGVCAVTPLMFSSPLVYSKSNGVVLAASLRSSQNYRIQANTNLASTNWITLTNFAAGTAPIFRYTNNTATNSPQRFYRIVSP